MSGEKYIIARHQEHPRWVQDDLPNFLETESQAREKGIPLEARQEHLSRQYWHYRRLASKCPKNSHDNIMRAWKLGQMFERQR